MSDSSDVSGQVSRDGSSEVSTRDPGVWKEPYFMPDGSRLVTAIDEDGVLRGAFFMREGDDEVFVHDRLASLLGHRAPATNIQVVK